MFVVIDGVDGSGKSTMVKRITKSLGYLYNVKTISFPSDNTESGKRARELLSSSDFNITELGKLFIDDYKESMKSIADILDKKDTILISDRYIDSFISYQGHLNGDKFVNDSIGSLDYTIRPDMTFILYVNPSKIYDRLSERGDDLDSIESRGISEMKNIQNRFLNIKDGSDRVIIDTTSSLEYETQVQILNRIEKNIIDERYKRSDIKKKYRQF